MNHQHAPCADEGLRVHVAIVQTWRMIGRECGRKESERVREVEDGDRKKSAEARLLINSTDLSVYSGSTHAQPHIRGRKSNDTFISVYVHHVKK